MKEFGAGIVIGMFLLLMLIIIPAELGYGTLGISMELLEECELNLPRDKRCVMAYIQEVEL